MSVSLPQDLELSSSNLQFLSSKETKQMESNHPYPPPNPLEPAVNLEKPSNSDLLDQTVHPQQVPTLEDSAVTRAEKYERHGSAENVEESSSKRRKLDTGNEFLTPTPSERQKGIAPIKKE